MTLKFKAAGDRNIVIEFENEISPEVNAKVRNMFLAVESANLPGVEELLPTYRSLMISYNPMETAWDKLVEELNDISHRIKDMEFPRPKIFEIPTLYAGETGPDIDFVASHNNLAVEEVVRIHCQEKYLIYMLGFTPGFPYLGGMPQNIAAPRLENPRTRIPAGSVGIAGTQTGIYPIESPGGWRLIGRTPIKLFNLDRQPHFLLQAGDYLQFKPVTESEYLHIKEQVEKNAYSVKTSLL